WSHGSVSWRVYFWTNRNNRHARSPSPGEGAPTDPPFSDTLHNLGCAVSHRGPDGGGYSDSWFACCRLWQRKPPLTTGFTGPGRTSDLSVMTAHGAVHCVVARGCA